MIKVLTLRMPLKDYFLNELKSYWNKKREFELLMLKKIANAVARSKNALAEETQHILCGVVFFTNQTNMPFSVVFL